MLYVLIGVAAFGGLATPAIQGLISRQVPPDEQGLLQGALAGLTNLTSVVGPPVAAGLFAYFVSPGAPFVLPDVAFFFCALLSLIALMVARRAFRQLPSSTPHDTPSFATD